MRDYGDTGTNSEKRMLTMKGLKEFFGTSKALHNVLKAKRIDVLSSQKVKIKIAIYTCLGTAEYLHRESKTSIKF